MKGVKRLTASTYEVGDFVAIVPDDHVFDGGDLHNGRGEESLGVLSNDEHLKLMMSDEAPTNFSAISELPTFRSIMTKSENMKSLHRRKYTYNSGVKLKGNAQDRM